MSQVEEAIAVVLGCEYRSKGKTMTKSMFNILMGKKLHSIMSVCVCMYVCVCVWQRYSPNGWMDFDEIFHKWSDKYLRGLFSSDFEISKRWRHGGHFCTFSLGHSHSRNFAPIFFKIGGEVESCLPLFAFENQRDQSVTSANMADRVWGKKWKWPPKLTFLKQGKWGV